MMKKVLKEEINEIRKMMGLNEGIFDFLTGKSDKEEIERFTCEDCGEYDYDMYMVNDDLWNQYGNDMKTLCQSCFEKRIGRKLGSKDVEQYSDLPANKVNPNIQGLS